MTNKKGGEKCLMDLEVEDLAEEEDGDLVLEEALPPGLLLA